MLRGKTVLITGASSGIGKAIAQLLVEQEATVYGLCRNTHNLSPCVTPLQCDLSDPSQIEATFAELSQLDILINNAGLAHLSTITSGDPAQWQEMWQLNVHASALCAQKALTLFPETGGHILNISSLSGHRVPPTGGFYAATKFALRAVTDALRAELKAAGNPTRVSSISPGFVDTPLLDTYFSGREEQLAQTRANINMLTPENIARTALHILTAPEGVEINDILLRSTDQAV